MRLSADVLQVCIDERRAKFRQDLISEAKIMNETRHTHRNGRSRQDSSYNAIEKPVHRSDHLGDHLEIPKKVVEAPKATIPSERYRRPSQHHLSLQHDRRMSASPARSLGRVSEYDEASVKSVSSRPASSQISLQLPRNDDSDEDEDRPQNIEEIWFPGCHAVSLSSLPITDSVG